MALCAACLSIIGGGTTTARAQGPGPVLQPYVDLLPMVALNDLDAPGPFLGPSDGPDIERLPPLNIPASPVVYPVQPLPGPAPIPQFYAPEPLPPPGGFPPGGFPIPGNGPTLGPTPVDAHGPAPAVIQSSPAKSPASGTEEIVLPKEVVKEVVKPKEPPKKIWDGNFELGLNGSDGNSDTFNINIGSKTNRKTDDMIFMAYMNYLKNTSDGKETANRFFGESRNEWLFKKTPWNYYVHGTFEYDEFRAFDVRLAADTGLGYEAWKNDVTSLRLRSGGGVSQELGGPSDDLVPEFTMGSNFDRKISKFQKLSATIDYFPNVTDWGDYRLNSKIDWNIVLCEEWNLSLKIGVVDRFDSTPSGKRRNDMNYSTTLLWTW